MTVLNVADDDQLIHQTSQTVVDDVAACLLSSGHTLINGDAAILVNDTLIAVSSDFLSLARSRRVIPESQQVGILYTILLITIGEWVNVPQHSIVARQNQAVLRIHRKQVGQEVQLVDGPVDDVHHGRVGQSRIGD